MNNNCLPFHNRLWLAFWYVLITLKIFMAPRPNNEVNNNARKLLLELSLCNASSIDLLGFQSKLKHILSPLYYMVNNIYLYLNASIFYSLTIFINNQNNFVLDEGVGNFWRIWKYLCS